MALDDALSQQISTPALPPAGYNKIYPKSDSQVYILTSSGVEAPVRTAALATKTTTYTLVPTDSVILADATSGSFTLTLPTAVGAAGQQFTIKKIDTGTNTVTVATTSSQTIDGPTTRVLRTPNLLITVASDGTNWQILAIVSTDPWHVVTSGFGSNWVGTLKYRSTGLDLVQVSFFLTSTTGTGGTVYSALPLGYRELNTTGAASPVYVASPTDLTSNFMTVVQLDTRGVITSFHVPGTAATSLQGNIIWALDF